MNTRSLTLVKPWEQIGNRCIIERGLKVSRKVSRESPNLAGKAIYPKIVADG